jgi:hypothetical protein
MKERFPTLKKSQRVVFESVTRAATEPLLGIVSIDISGPKSAPNKVRIGIQKARLPALVTTLLYLDDLLAKGHSGEVQLPKVTGETMTLSLEMGRLSVTAEKLTELVSVTFEVGGRSLSGQLLPATARDFASLLLSAADAIDGGEILTLGSFAL